jgi:hypothetical protein
MFTLMISRVCNVHLKKGRTFESLTIIGSGVLREFVAWRFIGLGFEVHLDCA